MPNILKYHLKTKMCQPPKCYIKKSRWKKTSLATTYPLGKKMEVNE
jgi:hypothetical protein